MPRAMKVCSTASCPEIVPAGQGRCDTCAAEADRARGTTHDRGYSTAGHRRFRRAVLTRDPICTAQTTCLAPSTVADHHPRSRKELIALGLDPNDPAYGRGICKPCHDHHTSQAQPGGWNQR